LGEKVLVTGGAGFMGSALTRRLLQEGFDVFIYDNFVTGSMDNVKSKLQSDKIIRGDIEGCKFVKAVSDVKPVAVYHLAAEAYIPTSYNYPERFVRTNFEGTLNVLMTCKTFDVKRVVYYSTSEVYGGAQTIPMNEQHPTLPQSVYAVSKLAADQLCRVLAKEQGIPVVVVRPFNCYGPRETHPYIVPEIISQLSKSDELVLGNLDARRDLTFVDDTARAVILLASKSNIDGQVFNVGSGVDYSVQDIVKATSSIMKSVPRIRVDKSRLRPFDLPRLLCDNSKVRNLTGWKPEVAFEDGLRRTVEWYEVNGKMWEWERRYLT
jgi:GDP-mannose 4,6-dehydratase